MVGYKYDAQVKKLVEDFQTWFEEFEQPLIKPEIALVRTFCKFLFDKWLADKIIHVQKECGGDVAKKVEDIFLS